MIDAERLARDLLHAADTATLLPVPSDADPSFDLTQAFAVADRVRALRLARGDVPLGYKIGFTNRSLWARYADERSRALRLLA